MTKQRVARAINRPVANLVIAPFERVWDSPMVAKLGAIFVATMTTIRTDVLFLIIIALIISNVCDTLLGREVARQSGSFDPAYTRAGFLTKVSGFALIAIVRIFEEWAANAGIPGLELFNGLFATTVTLTLLAYDVESIEGHRVALGARPIPIITRVAAGMRILEGILLAKTSKPEGTNEPQRASTDG